MTLLHDLRAASRSLLRHPSFTVGVLCTLILGMASTVAVFSVLDQLLLRPLPVEEPAELYSVFSETRGEDGSYSGYGNFDHEVWRTLREAATPLADVAIYQWHAMNLGGDEPQRITGAFVSANYFDLLGIEPILGRFFDDGESRGIVLSAALWRSRFGGDPGALGGVVDVNGSPREIVGVAPPGFSGTETGLPFDLWLPLATYRELGAYRAYFDARGVGLFRMIARLEEGAAPESADAEVMALAQRVASEDPGNYEGLGAGLVPLTASTIRPDQRGRFVGYGRVLAAGALVLLLITCFNVASLLTVRGLDRRGELSVRRALGATRWRVSRQLLLESMLLFGGAAVLSVPAAWLLMSLLWRIRPPNLHHSALQISVAPALVGATLLTSLLASVVFGVWPALRPLRSGRQRRLLGRGRSAVVVAQVALSFVSLVAAGVYQRALLDSRSRDLGFDAERIAVVTLTPGDQGLSEEASRALFRRAVERARTLPGVESAALAENRLLRGAVLRRQVFAHGSQEAALSPLGDYHRVNAVGDDYFRTTGVRLIAGEDFAADYPDGHRPIAIVNRTMAEALWPQREAVGQTFRFDFPDREPVTVVGVAENARVRHLEEPEQFFLYVPMDQQPSGAMTLHVRHPNPESLLPALRRELAALAPEVPLADLRALTSWVEEARWPERSAAIILSVFGALALALSLLGVYSVLAHAVSARRRDLSVRLALGASRRRLLAGVAGTGVVLLLIGTAFGFFISQLVLMPMVVHRVAGIPATPLAAYAGTAALLLLAGGGASLLTARRARLEDAASVLRAD